jgi:RNA polymerase sigma-70 factor (ECF subfamily)
MDFSDQTVLLASLQTGEFQAFDYLYNTSRNRLFVLAYCIIKEEEAARDLVQDFFIDFWQKKLYLNIQGGLSGYLTSSIRNRAINFVQKEATHRQRISQLPIPDGFFEMKMIENKELRADLETALEKLPQAAGQVFRLHYIEQLSHAEIAAKLGISKSSVSSHIDRALKSLRKNLKKG